MTQAARVCVITPRECPTADAEKTESHDGVASPPRSRGRCPRQFRLSTTTNYILVLDSSSTGRESNDKVSLLVGGAS